MIHKAMDRRRVTHHNVLGFRCLVTLCGLQGFVQRDLSPASWRRRVDCMTCLVQAASLPWCGHGTGEVIRVDPTCDATTPTVVYRRCHRCTLSACAT